MSLRFRLVLLFLAGTLLVWVPVNYIVYRLALGEIDELWDSHLEQSARVLMALATASAERGDLESLAGLLPKVVPTYLPQPHAVQPYSGADQGDLQRSFAFQLIKPDGSFRLDSTDAPEQLLADGVPGFSQSLIGPTTWRVFGLGDPKHALVLYAGEDRATREALAAHLVEHLLFPTLFAIPPALFLIWLLTRSGLAPPVQLVKEVKARDPRDLRPLSGQAVPVEVKPLVAALNSLLARLGHTLAGEQSFTGNAAHELRTPLAALRVQAQVAERATDDAQRRRALGKIIAGVDQTAHLVDQLLILSRLDTQDTALSEGPVNLLDIARRTAAGLERLTLERSVSLQVDGAEDALTHGDDTCIGILMRNLIDNGVRYTPAGGTVTVSIRKSGLFNRVTVTDTGPGIADDQQAEMFRRFRRGSETQTSGSGLGLSIVHRICELLDGSVRLSNRAVGGLCCEVRLPTYAGKTDNASPAEADAQRPNPMPRSTSPMPPQPPSA